jgi:hypothetical protein
MIKGLYLVGGRFSKLFAVAELLRYPLPSKHIKDADEIYTISYKEKDEPVRNPFHPKRYSPFTNFSSFERLIPNFINETTMKTIQNDLTKYNKTWFNHFIGINKKIICEVPSSNNRLDRYQKYINKHQDNELSYYFLKSGNHYKECKCAACKLDHTIKSFEMLYSLSRIVGKNILKINECLMVHLDYFNFVNFDHNHTKGKYRFLLFLNSSSTTIKTDNETFISSSGMLFVSESKGNLKIPINSSMDIVMGWFDSE